METNAEETTIEVSKTADPRANVVSSVARGLVTWTGRSCNHWISNSSW